MKININSAAFKDGELIPLKHTCDGEDISPQLNWDRPSDKTKTFALIVNDPDAKGGDFVHWVVFNIPSNITEFPEDVTPIKNISEEASFGTNSFGHIGYGGPCPNLGNAQVLF